MNMMPQIPITMFTPAVYQVRFKGNLDPNWQDWFNGTAITFEEGHAGKPYTALTCKVRDQAELLGLLNRINSLNLPLIQVILIGAGVHQADA